MTVDDSKAYEDATHIVPIYDTRHKPAPIPDAGLFDAPTAMLCINMQWWVHIVDCIDRLAWRDAWRNGTDEEKQSAVDNIIFVMAEIQKGIECGDMAQFLLRQNPSDSCELQQSTDGGQSWTLAFDFEQCGAFGGATVVDIDIAIAQTYINDLKITYDIDINLIGAKLSNNNASTDTAICHALGLVVRGALIGALERIESDNNQELIIQSVAGGIAIVSAFVFGTPFAGVSTAIGVAVGLIASATFNALEEQDIRDAIESENVIKELQCCAYASLAGTKPTETSFEQAWDNCTGLSQLAQSVLPLLQEVAENIDLFLTFLESANQAYDYAENGVLGNECLSCSDLCYNMTDLTDITILLGSLDPLQGLPPPSIENADGVNSSAYPLNGSGTNSGIATAMEIELPSERSVIEVSFDYLMSQDKDTAVGSLVRLLDNLGNIVYSDSAVSSINADGQWHTATFTMNEPNIASVIVASFRTSTPTVTGFGLIDNVCIK